MSERFSLDVSEVRRLSVSLAAAGPELSILARKVIQVGAGKIKADMQAEAAGHPRFPHFPRSITYDTRVTATGPESEVGPDKSRTQGPLGNLLYFGTARTGPVLPNPAHALEREAATVVRLLGEASERTVL